jgi:hypothetical protein
MPPERPRPRLSTLLRNEVRRFFQLHPSPRPWQMPVAAALASGLPLLIGAAFDHLAWGLVASIGGLSFLYLPTTALHHRMPWIMTCAFGMAACHALGLLTHFVPQLAVPLITLIGIVVMMLVRFHAVPPPGGVFFMMSASIGAFTPLHAGSEVPPRVGLLTLGAVLACLIAFFYSLEVLRHREPLREPAHRPSFDYVIFDGTLIGIGHMMPGDVMLARFTDTVLGSFVGLAGGVCMHSPRFRNVVGGWMRRLAPRHRRTTHR